MGTHPVLVTAHRPVLTLVPQIFLCTDLWKDTETLRAAYHDSKGVTEAFIKNGIQHAMCTLGFPEAGHPSKWDYEVSSLLRIQSRGDCFGAWVCSQITMYFEYNSCQSPIIVEQRLVKLKIRGGGV